MAIPFVEEYKKGTFNFPPDNIPFKNKDEKWHREYANAVMADYATDRCGISYSERDKILENRRFAEGTNSEDLFKDIILEYQRDEGERQAYSSMDYSIIPIISKFKSVFIGILSGVNHRATANSIDPISLRKKTIEKEKKWIKRVFEDQLAPLDEKLGIKQIDPEYVPKSRAELDMYDQFGGFKLGLEIGLEAGLKHCFAMSRWDEEIRPQVLSDIFDNKMFACRDYFDPNTYSIKTEYVDIANGIVQASASPTFDTSRYKGFIKYYTIADIRVLTTGQPGWDEERLKKIAKKFASQTANAGINWSTTPVGNQYGPANESSASATQSYAYDPYLIPVAVLEFQSTMYEYDVERTDEAGNVSYYKTDRDRKYDRTDRKSITTEIKVWHKVSIVIGCNEIFDFGLQHDIPRPTYDDARSSFHFFRMKGISYCQRAIPHAKQIQLMYLKIQGLALKAVPPGIAFEWNALKGMILNDKELNPFDILKIYGQTGNVGYQTTNVRGHRLEGGGAPPIKELKGSYSLADLLGIIVHHKSEIREITGIDETAGKTEPTAYQAKLTSVFTDIALKESYNAYIAMVKDTAINAAARLRDLLAYSEKAREIYGPIIGMTNMELLDLVKDLPLAHLAIDIEIEANDEDKQTLIDAAIAAMKPGKEGVPVLRFSDFLFIQQLAKKGMVKYGHAYIAHKEAEIEKTGIERATKAKEMDTEMAVTVSKQKREDEKDVAKFTTDEKIREYEAQKEADDKFAKKEHDRQMDLERLKLNAKDLVPA